MLIIIDHNITGISDYVISYDNKGTFISNSNDEVLYRFINYPSEFIIPVLKNVLKNKKPGELDYTDAVYMENGNIIIDVMLFNSKVNDLLRKVSLDIYDYMESDNPRILKYQVKITEDYKYGFRSEYLTGRTSADISREDVETGKIMLVDYTEDTE